ncbi:MAG: histidine kinase [Lachnospiraceae bacterium]|nr:histidine kinase [Lachnospiraceae bacterium]
MKTKVLNITGAAVLFIMAIAALVMMCRSSGQSVMSMPYLHVFQGKYSRDGLNWMPLQSDSDISALDGDLYLRGSFGYALGEGECVNYYLDHISIKSICLNGEEIFGGTSLESEYAGRDMCGELWNAWCSPGIQENDVLEIHLHNPHSFGNGNAYREFLDSLYGTPQLFFKEWLGKITFPFWMTGTIVLIISLIMIGISFGLLVIRIPSGEMLLHAGFFDMFMGGYILLDTVDISMKNSLIVFNTCARHFCIMLAGIELVFCILKSLNGKAAKAARAALSFLILSSGLLLVLIITGKMMLYDTEPYLAAVQAIVCIVLLCSCLSECFTGEKANFLPAVSFLPVLFSSLLELLDFFMYWWRSGICIKSVFLLFFVYQIVRIVLYVLAGCRAAADAQRLSGELRNSRIMLATSQIRTHFIFNVLNAISGMCKYDPEKADETVVRFARYLRKNINFLREDKPISFYKELEYVEDYVALEQIRFGDKIVFRENLEEEDFLVPAFVLQPLVENSIKHGILPKDAGGIIELWTKREGKNIVISVSDNGVGYDVGNVKKEESIGLNNVLFRLQNMVNGTMVIESRPGEGTTVTITMPYMR